MLSKNSLKSLTCDSSDDKVCWRALIVKNLSTSISFDLKLITVMGL